MAEAIGLVNAVIYEVNWSVFDLVVDFGSALLRPVLAVFRPEQYSTSPETCWQRVIMQTTARAQRKGKVQRCGEDILVDGDSVVGCEVVVLLGCENVSGTADQDLGGDLCCWSANRR